MAKPREAASSFRDRMVYLISPVNLRVPLPGTMREIQQGSLHAAR
jgi:hypothetical protein